jgi:Flp pilus assembly protein TadG
MRSNIHFKNRLIGKMLCRASLQPGSPFEGDAGQGLVEFAIVLPLMVLLLLGAIELGWMAYLKVAVTNAARAGVQYGSQSQTTAADTTGMQNAAKNDVPSITNLTVTPQKFCECSASLGTTVSCNGSACSTSRMIMYVKVDTSTPYVPWVPYPGLPQSATVQGSATMRVLQ